MVVFDRVEMLLSSSISIDVLFDIRRIQRVSRHRESAEMQGQRWKCCAKLEGRAVA